jgi:hypothetical protein
MYAAYDLYDGSFHCNDVFDGGGATDHTDQVLCDLSVAIDDTCDDTVEFLVNDNVVHDDGLFESDCNSYVIGSPIELSEALYCTSDFKHIYFCSVSPCNSCISIHSSLLSSLHASLGFLPTSPIPSTSFLLDFSSVPSPPSVVSFLSSYLSIQSHYTGSPNFISKVAPAASHLNFTLLRELSQGFHDTQILYLNKYSFPLDLDKSSFLQNSAVTNHRSALKFPATVDSYFSSETHFGSMLGPFPDPPFPDLHCSPILTPPKGGKDHRVIVDLSCLSAHRQAVNESVSKSHYAGTPF